VLSAVADDRAAFRPMELSPPCSNWNRNAVMLTNSVTSWRVHFLSPRPTSMRVPNCVLTPEEEAIVSQIDFDASTLRTSEDMERNGAAAAALMESLSARNAKPEMRLRYFTDPVYFVGGRGKSRKDLLERGGNKEKEIFRRPEFLSYLHYFLHGPSLPQNIVDAFRNEVENCGDLRSGEIVRLRKFAREQVRAHAQKPARSAEEFYKLTLDSGLPVSFAQLIHNSAKQVVRRRYPRRRTTNMGDAPQPDGIRVSAIPGAESIAFQPAQGIDGLARPLNQHEPGLLT
jgi:hypothetical protein